MADTKISALPASTTPLAGTEVLPIVQGGATRQVSVANLTAGRAPSVFGLTVSGLTASTALALNASKELVSVTNTGTGNNVLATTPTLVGDATLSTGNLIVSAANKGMAFPNNTITEDKVASFKKSASTTVATGAGRSDIYFFVDANQTFTITLAGLGGLVTIINGSAGEACTFFWSWNTATITILGNGGTSFAATSTPASGQIGIFKSATSEILSFKSAVIFSAGNIAVSIVGDYASATTDPV